MIGREARLFLIALQFLTRIPIGSVGAWPPDWLARAAKYMPLVGALIGAVAGAAVLASALFFPEPLPIVIGLATAIAVTGALHEDGLADTVDAFGGGKNREHCLEIMKDSRIGTYGTLALIVVLALKGAALLSLDPLSAACVFIAAHSGARLGTVLTLWTLSYAGDGGSAKVSRPASELTLPELAIAIVLGLTPGLLLLKPATFFVSAAFAFVAATAMALMARRRVGGYTGDVLGAIEQAYETTFFVFAAAIIAGPG
jgi:adenosylcobinamide-GDP ribazoletransferase